MRDSKFQFFVVLLLVFLGIQIGGSTPAFALDKRVKLLFKTSGYGAAAGAVVGAGTMALGLGGVRNILMGASSGLYAGILLAAYVIATPDEDQPVRKYQNPYAPKRPLNSEDWEEGSEDDYRDYLPKPAPQAEPSSDRQESRTDDLLVWTPVLQIHF